MSEKHKLTDKEIYLIGRMLHPLSVQAINKAKEDWERDVKTVSDDVKRLSIGLHRVERDLADVYKLLYGLQQQLEGLSRVVLNISKEVSHE